MNRSQYSHRLSRVMLDAIHHVNIGKCARPDDLRSRRQTTVFAYSEIKALENKFDRLLDKLVLSLDAFIASKERIFLWISF